MTKTVVKGVILIRTTKYTDLLSQGSWQVNVISWHTVRNMRGKRWEMIQNLGMKRINFDLIEILRKNQEINAMESFFIIFNMIERIFVLLIVFCFADFVLFC